MEQNFISRFVARLIETGFARLDQIRGCSEEEIVRLESHLGLRLPAAYREFLAVMGKGAGDFYRGTDIFYSDLLFGLYSVLQRMLEEDQMPFRLREDAVIFSSHQGYIFSYFHASEGDNPPVWGYHELHTAPKLIDDTFNEFLDSSLDDFLAIRAKYPR